MLLIVKLNDKSQNWENVLIYANSRIWILSYLNGIAAKHWIVQPFKSVLSCSAFVYKNIGINQ